MVESERRSSHKARRRPPTRLTQMDQLPAAAREVWNQLGDEFLHAGYAPGRFAEDAGIRYMLRTRRVFKPR